MKARKRNSLGSKEALINAVPTAEFKHASNLPLSSSTDIVLDPTTTSTSLLLHEQPIAPFSQKASEYDDKISTRGLISSFCCHGPALVPKMVPMDSMRIYHPNRPCDYHDESDCLPLSHDNDLFLAIMPSSLPAAISQEANSSARSCILLDRDNCGGTNAFSTSIGSTTCSASQISDTHNPKSYCNYSDFGNISCVSASSPPVDILRESGSCSTKEGTTASYFVNAGANLTESSSIQGYNNFLRENGALLHDHAHPSNAAIHSSFSHHDISDLLSSGHHQLFSHETSHELQTDLLAHHAHLTPSSFRSLPPMVSLHGTNSDVVSKEGFLVVSPLPDTEVREKDGGSSSSSSSPVVTSGELETEDEAVVDAWMNVVLHATSSGTPGDELQGKGNTTSARNSGSTAHRSRSIISDSIHNGWESHSTRLLSASELGDSEPARLMMNGETMGGNVEHDVGTRSKNCTMLHDNGVLVKNTRTDVLSMPGEEGGEEKYTSIRVKNGDCEAKVMANNSSSEGVEIQGRCSGVMKKQKMSTVRDMLPNVVNGEVLLGDKRMNWSNAAIKPLFPSINCAPHRGSSTTRAFQRLQYGAEYDTDESGGGSEANAATTNDKKDKRKMSNRASAKRSRQRRQDLLEKLELDAATLRVQNASLMRKLGEAENKARKLKSELDSLLKIKAQLEGSRKKDA